MVNVPEEQVYAGVHCLGILNLAHSGADEAMITSIASGGGEGADVEGFGLDLRWEYGME
jgi:hypothetical protein